MKRRPWNDRIPTNTGRAALEHETGPVKLMPEYSCELPLWGRSWRSLNLPAPLLDRLADWQDDFDDNFDAFSGWKSPEAHDRWEEQSVGLIRDLERSLNGVTLTVDLWPLEDIDGT